MKAAFYCVSDERYFLGAVGLINSLRLVGHTEPIYLLDCGLTEAQRELLAGEVELVDAPAPATPPWLLKTHAPRVRSSEVTVLVDTDMIVTKPLTPLIERAAAGHTVAFKDRQQRYCDGWGELLGLGASSPGPYVSSGLVFFGPESGREILELLDERQRRVDFELTFWRQNVRDYPFRYADQDVLNAILSTRADSQLEALDEQLAATPPFRGLRITNHRTLACAYRDETEPYVLHQYVRKPWLEATYNGVYSQLLRRLLVAGDTAVRPAEETLPLRMRTGGRARAERARINAVDFLRWHLGDRLPQPIANRVEDLRRLRAADAP